MNNYADAQRRANEFNAQAPKDEIAELKQKMCVLAQAVIQLIDNQPNHGCYDTDRETLVFNLDYWGKHREILCKLIANLTPPPAGGRGSDE